MKKIIFLIICFFIISCSVKNDEKIESNSWKTEKNFYIWNHDWWIELVWNKEKTWNNTLKFIYENQKNLIIWINRKDDLKFLEDIKNFKWNSIMFEIFTEEVKLKKILINLNNLKWELLNFNIKNENIKNFEISDEEKEIFRSLDFKTKNIFVNWKEINL